MIIDCHGHYTTAPKELEAFRQKQIAELKEPSSARSKAAISITDDQIRESIDKAQLKLQRERGSDVTIFSPRAAGMGHHNGDATTFMQLITGDLFKDFPSLRFIIPHGGGAVPYHWGRYRGIAQDLKKPLLKDHLLNNVFFDTCVYHQPGIDLLFKVIPVDNILFASEMVGAVRGIDPETGNYYDDTKRYVDALRLGNEDRHKIFEGNARRVYSRLKNKIPASR